MTAHNSLKRSNDLQANLQRSSGRGQKRGSQGRARFPITPMHPCTPAPALGSATEVAVTVELGMLC